MTGRGQKHQGGKDKEDEKDRCSEKIPFVYHLHFNAPLKVKDCLPYLNVRNLTRKPDVSSKINPSSLYHGGRIF
jgi:hypothetical protein